MTRVLLAEGGPSPAEPDWPDLWRRYELAAAILGGAT